MTLMEFFGCTFIAYGPIFSLFFWTVARDPLKIILFISAAFFWLVSLLLSSTLWYAVVPLREELAFGLVCSVIFQELFRFAYYLLLKRAEQGLQKFTDTGVKPGTQISVSRSRLELGFVAGQGFGAVSGAFSLVNVLAESAGPGTVGIRGDPSHFLLVSSVLASAFILLNICWTLVLYTSLDQTSTLKKFWGLILIFTTHLLASCITLSNHTHHYSLSLPIVLLTTLLLLLLTLYLLGVTPSSCLACVVGAPPQHLDVLEPPDQSPAASGAT